VIPVIIAVPATHGFPKTVIASPAAFTAKVVSFPITRGTFRNGEFGNACVVAKSSAFPEKVAVPTRSFVPAMKVPAPFPVTNAWMTSAGKLGVGVATAVSVPAKPPAPRDALALLVAVPVAPTPGKVSVGKNPRSSAKVAETSGPA
jgi:hypothetical protein